MGMSDIRPTEMCGAGARRAKFVRRFGRDQRGSVAIEFSLLALPFALLLFAILESCISFAAQEVLANTTDDIARQVRTGQLRAADLDAVRLRKMVCDRMEIIVSSGCPGLAIDLRAVDSFQAATGLGAIWNASKTDIDTSDFDVCKLSNGVSPCQTLSKLVLRVVYRWPTVMSYMGNLPNNKTLHFSMAAWQNEPF